MESPEKIFGILLASIGLSFVVSVGGQFLIVLLIWSLPYIYVPLIILGVFSAATYSAYVALDCLFPGGE
jgi:hypothetical protein